jgi:hypothetical protein
VRPGADPLAQEPRLFNAVLWALILAVALMAFGYHVQICFFPYQRSPSEAGFYQSVRALHLGLNPWAPENAPDYFNTYGIGYPWLVQQLKRLAPAMPLLTVLRLCTAGSIFLALGMLFLAMRDAGARWMESSAACLCVYAGLLYSDTPNARADGLMVALYVMAVVWVLRPGRASALTAGVLAGLGFFVKPQGLLAAPVAIALLWTQGRRKDAGWVMLATLGTWLAMAGLMAWKFPYYFEGTSLLQFATKEVSLAALLNQWYGLAQIHWPVLLLAAGSLVWAWSRGKSVAPQGAARAWALGALTVWVVFILGPGGHLGAYLTYYNHQFLPFFFVFLVLWLLQLGLKRQVLALVLVINAASALGVSLLKEPLASDEDLRIWKTADAWVGAHPFGIYPPIFTTLVIKNRAFLLDTDHSHCLSSSRNLGRHVLADAYEQKLQEVGRALVQRRFQTVVCSSYWPCPPGIEALGYREVAPFDFKRGANQFKVYVPR